MKKMTIGNHLTPYLLGICVLLSGILAFESHNLIQVQNNSSPKVQPEPAPVAQPGFTAPGITAYTEVTERPLFREGREPQPEPKAAPITRAPPSPLRLHLEGIAITPTSEIAVVRDLSSNKMLHLAKGTEHQGWKLTSITATGVTFIRGQQSQELTLKTDENTRRR